VNVTRVGCVVTGGAGVCHPVGGGVGVGEFHRAKGASEGLRAPLRRPRSLGRRLWRQRQSSRQRERCQGRCGRGPRLLRRRAVEWCSDEGKLVLWRTGRRSTHGQARPHVDGASPRVVERGPGRVVLALAAAGGRRTATATAATTASAATTATTNARSTEGGGGLVLLLRATGGGEGRGGSGGGIGVEC
jgi:hypothetical protein